MVETRHACEDGEMQLKGFSTCFILSLAMPDHYWVGEMRA
jgi:hypothetical protein